MPGFPRSSRLLQPADFKRVLGKGRRSRQRLFTAVSLRAPGGHARLGLTVSRKAMPRAVDRNRFKRTCRETFRQQATLPAADVVIMATPQARQAAPGELAQALQTYFEQLRDRWPASSSS